MNTADCILERNETDANLFAGRFLLIMAVASIVLIAYYFTSGLTDWSQKPFLIIGTGVMQLTRIGLYGLIKVRKGKGARLKNLIVACILLTAVIDSLFLANVNWVFFVLPILYSIRYSQKRFTLLTGIHCTVFAAVMIFAAVYYGLQSGTVSMNYIALTEDVAGLEVKKGVYGFYNAAMSTGLVNVKGVYKAALFDAIMPFISLIVCAIISYLIVSYNSAMVRKEIEQFELIQEKEENISAMQQKVVLGLANLIENRDNNTGGHVKRTSEIIGILVEEYQKQYPGVLDEQMAMDIVRAAPMHDLGKIEIDNSILNKPGKLTDEEFAIMRTHSAKSDDIVGIILEDVEEKHFVDTAHHVARSHHERWDGRGYPDKLAEEQIPVEARILAIADVYDALVSKRVYKQPMSFEDAERIMREGMGSQFDPQMENVFSACREKLEAYYRENR